jgi:hypothetical protein
MDYLDFEICIGAGEGRIYPVHVVRSPAGEKRATMTFPFDELALKSHIQDLQIALLKSASTRRDMSEPQEQLTVKEFGQTLFEAVLPDEVRSSYRLSREKAREQHKGLRIRLRIEAPDLAALPWEFLYDESEGNFVCLSNETPIVRYLELDRPPEPVEIEPPLRVLGMIAAPEDRPQLNVSRERQRMSEAIAALDAKGRVTLTWLEGQTWQDLQRAMRKGPWHVFHFVGHGGFDAQSGEGMLALAKEDGRTHRLPATKLGQLLADHRPLRLAVLNACQGAQASADDIFSSTASVLIRRGIPAVVAMQYEITDRAAIEFSRGFYESLAEGLPVDAAVAEARKAVNFSMAYTVEWGTPVLHMRSPDGRLFDLNAFKSRVGLPPLPATQAPEPELAAEPVVEVAPSPASSVPPAPVEASAEAPAPRPEPVREGSSRPPIVWAGAAAGVLLLAALAFFLFRNGEGPDVLEVFATPTVPIGQVLLSPEAAMLETDETLRIGVALMDTLGNGMDERDVMPAALAWTAEPEGIVEVVPDTVGLGAVVRGLTPGTVSVTATASDASGSSPADTKQLTVLPSEAQRSAALRRYIAAGELFNDAEVSNTDVVAAYAALGPVDRRALVEDDAIASTAEIDSLEQAVGGLAALYDSTREASQSDTLTLGQKRAAWQAYVDRAGAVRSSPSTARAVAARDSLRALAEASTSFVSLVLCQRGGLDCPESAQADTFAAGASVYFTARMNLPTAERIRWAWRGPEGEVIDEGDDSFPAAPGYRTFQQLRDTERPGRYALHLYSEAGHLIGRRTFTVL